MKTTRTTATYIIQEWVDDEGTSWKEERENGRELVVRSYFRRDGGWVQLCTDHYGDGGFIRHEPAGAFGPR